MKRLWIITVVVALVGCGTDVLPGRLDVQDPLRTACPGLTDAEIDSFISAAESDRLNGWSYQSEISEWINFCETFTCSQCGIAVIDQVYGM